jgi:hypothetical protein
MTWPSSSLRNLAFTKSLPFGVRTASGFLLLPLFANMERKVEATDSPVLDGHRVGVLGEGVVRFKEVPVHVVVRGQLPYTQVAPVIHPFGFLRYIFRVGLCRVYESFRSRQYPIWPVVWPLCRAAASSFLRDENDDGNEDLLYNLFIVPRSSNDAASAAIPDYSSSCSPFGMVLILSLCIQALGYS